MLRAAHRLCFQVASAARIATLSAMVRLKALRLLSGAVLPLILWTAPVFAQNIDDDEDLPSEDEEPDDEPDEEPDDEEPSEEPDDDSPSEDPDSKSEEDKPTATEDAVATDDSSDDADEEVTISAEEKDAASDESAEEKSQKTVVEAPKKPPTPVVIDEEESPEPSEHAQLLETEEAAAAALTDLPDTSPSLLPLTLSTSTWSRFEVRENYDKLGVSQGRTQEGDQVVFRARLGVETNPIALTDTSDALIKFAPQASGNWGQNGSVGEADLGIYEGYFKIRTERLDTQVGRMMMNYGDALVIGDLDWNEKGQAFDAVRFHYKMERGYLDVFGAQLREGHPQGADQFLGGDGYFWGAYAGVGKYLAPSLDLDFYFLGLSQVGQDDGVIGGTAFELEGSNLFTLGARIKQKVSAFDYRLEAGLQFGQSSALPLSAANVPASGSIDAQTALAYQADGEVGVTFDSGTHISLGGVIASGDNPWTADKNEGWNQLFPTGHKFLGLMDIIGKRTNVLSGNLKISQNLTDSLTAKVDGHLFARVEAGGAGNVGGPGFSGTEVDAQLMQNIGKYVQIRGLYGLFIPASGHFASDDLAHYGEIQAGFVY